jgi:hypothetical protein
MLVPILSALCSIVTITAAEKSPDPKQPPVGILQSGDILWTKQPDAFVPYASPESGSPAIAWEHERDQELARLQHLQHRTIEEEQRYSSLRHMGYRAFQEYYFNDVKLDTDSQYGASSSVYVGHSAIVEKTASGAFVIEAVPVNGVHRIPLTDWLHAHSASAVWAGRLSGVSAEQRAAVARAAASQIGKPYAFWNFDLADASGFYCSKLVWWSIKTATGISIEGDTSGRRALWYSPKRMMRSDRITLIYNPENY